MFEYQGFREYLENTQYQSCVSKNIRRKMEAGGKKERQAVL